ncbi:MAG: porin [Ramlibacter sp.]|nr:porin [Ramlibacter sp.]
MKKSLIALAVLATAGVASAQSSVTLFGIADATLAFGKGSGVGSSNKTQLTNSGYNSSRLGFRGTEDLGGGMSASFWLEASALTDNGAGGTTSTNNQATGATGGGGLTFNRRSTVSLAGNFGEIRLGRDYTPQFWNLTVFDPFGTNGVGTTQTLNSSLGGPTIVRASNAMGYFLPKNLGGFYGQVQYYLGENNKTGAATEKDGTGTALRLGYAAGPVNAALAFSSTKYATGNIKSANIGGQYDLGVAKLMAHYARDRVDSTPSVTGKGYLLGGLIPMGAGEIRVAYSVYKTDAGTSPKSKKLALGYVHNLSKRTALYTTFARVSNSGGAASALNGAVTAANNNSTGYDFGIRHSF